MRLQTGLTNQLGNNLAGPANHWPWKSVGSLKIPGGQTGVKGAAPEGPDGDPSQDWQLYAVPEPPKA